jgi:hypothetical protein
MKTQSFSRAFLFLVTGTALLLLSATSNAAPTREHSTLVIVPSLPFASSLRDGGRLVIRRYPALGRNLIVTLTIDGAPARGIAYGQTYETFLRPGRHVLSVVPAPRARFNNPWKTTLDVRVGRTYYFTAKVQGGVLVLQRNSP